MTNKRKSSIARSNSNRFETVELSECKALQMEEGGWLLMSEDEEGRPHEVWVWERDLVTLAQHPLCGLFNLLNMHACQYAHKVA